MNELLLMLSYPFAVRALVAGALVALCAALLGVNLVLKRLSMLGDGLSHVSFGAAAVALAVGAAPLKISIPVVVIAAFLLMRLNENGKWQGDAATAIVSSSSLAIGIIVATLTTGMNTDISNYMFGSILAMSRRDVLAVAAVAIVVLAVYGLCYEKIFACTFEEKFAAATGVPVRFYNGLTAVLTALVVVVGMRMMGALLISSVMTFPALSSMRLAKTYRATVLGSVALSLLAFAVGMLLAFGLDMPAGASIVVIHLLIFLVSSAVSKAKRY